MTDAEYWPTRICDGELIIQESRNPQAWVQSADTVEVRR